MTGTDKNPKHSFISSVLNLCIASRPNPLGSLSDDDLRRAAQPQNVSL
jgi:hypothetical protein